MLPLHPAESSSRRCALVLACCIAWLPFAASGHVPHDVIHVLAVSPNFEQDGTLFAVLHNARLRSVDGGGSWKSFGAGLPLRYKISDISFSPQYASDRTVFLTSEGDGAFRSQDGGVTWRSIQGDLGERHLAKVIALRGDSDGEQLYVSGNEGGLWCSENGGATWKTSLEPGIRVRHLAVRRDVSTSPANGGVLVLGEDRTLWRSAESGSWRMLASLPFAAPTALALAAGLEGGEVIWLGSRDGLWRSGDGGVSFQPMGGPLLSGQHITSVAVAGDGTIYCTSWNRAVYVSRDAGSSFRLFDEGLSSHEQADMLGYPHFRAVVPGSKAVFVAGFAGLFHSEDQGRHWNQLRTYRLEAFQVMTFAPDFETTGRIVAATDHAGVYLSEDRGDSWRPIHMGLTRTNLSAVAFGSRGRLYATTNDGFFVTPRVGATWKRVGLEEVSLSWLERLNPFRDKPSREAFPIGIVESPNFENDETLWLPTRRLGVLRSEDGGKSWWQQWKEQNKYVDDLMASPDFANDGALFAAVRGRGLFVSVDQGESWKNLSESIIDRIRPGAGSREHVQLAISPGFAHDRTIFLGTASGLMRSRDAGRSWSEMPVSLPVHAVVVSPGFVGDGVVLVSVDGEGVLKSTDHGSTFRPVGEQLLAGEEILEAIFVSPTFARDSTLIGASMNHLFRSTDAGETWQRLAVSFRYENHDSVVAYEGAWVRRSHPQMSSSGSAETLEAARAVLQFVGSGVSWVGSRSPAHGRARVQLDGGDWKTVELAGPREQWLVELYSRKDLEAGAHTLVIESAGDGLVSIDAFDVQP